MTHTRTKQPLDIERAREAVRREMLTDPSEQMLCALLTELAQARERIAELEAQLGDAENLANAVAWSLRREKYKGKFKTIRTALDRWNRAAS